MVIFWFVMIAMTLVAVALVVVPLWRTPKSPHTLPLKSHVALYRERLHTLEQQLAQGEITPQVLAQARLELKQALLQETPPAVVAFDTRPSRYLALLLALVVPLSAGLLYWHWGASRQVAQWRLAEQRAALVKSELAKFGSPEQVAAALRARLQQEPRSAQGWYLLGSLYLDLQHYPQAAAALAQANTLKPNDLNTLIKYAEALFLADHKLDAQAHALLQQALQLDPHNVNALNLLAITAYQAGDYATAIHTWKQLLPQFAPDSAEGKTLLAMISAAEQRLQQSTSSKTASLHVYVSLPPEVSAQVTPAATVFVYAQAVAGPPMPLAVVRKQVRDLPCTVSLDQSQAMLAGVSLQNADAVRVTARVSKSGQALPQAGDWQGTSATISLQHPPAQLKVVIDKLTSVRSEKNRMD